MGVELAPDGAGLTAMEYRPVVWITHPECLRHEMGPQHPESPRRLQAIQDRLRATGLDQFLVHREAPRATEADLLRVHTREHVDSVLHADASAGPVRIDADTALGEHTLAAALHAAGAGILGVDLVLAGEAGLAFCAVRPPGHHAERARAMGFCFFNNIAVAAGHALARGLTRIAVLDFDLHYGNGTADIFLGDERVWLYSTYQHPLYPHWTGAPHATNLVDAPLRPYAGSEAYRAAITGQWLPALQRQQPQLILVSAGFDAHADDPLGDLRLTTDDYRWTASVIRGVAAECADGRVVAMLEGGYDLTALARSVEAFLGAFLGNELPL